MNKKLILFTLGFALVASMLFLSIDNTKEYYSAGSGFMSNKQFTSNEGMKLLYTMRANQITGVVDYADIESARRQLNNMRLSKAGFPLEWEESGPDNVGGRCRTILIDRANPSVLYAAGVSGGIFKSTNAAGSWSPINDNMSTLAFQSSCQTVDGTIYFGSGENSGSFGGSGESEGSSFPGEGIFKSTDGVTFTQLSTTKSFTYVNSMASHPTSNTIFAGTNLGYRYSEDAGASWKSVTGLTGSCRDVKVANNGTVIAYAGGKIFRSTTGTSNFVASTGLPGGFNRLVIAISPQDPNYVYVMASQSNNFGGLFQSTDGGVTFSTIVPGGSTVFNPLNQGAGGQGDYDLCVAVHPRDKKHVYMGGVIMAEWTELQGPFEVSNGTHADHHWFTFDTISSPMRMYNGNDGGVYRSLSSKFNAFAAYNIGFNVTQFYGVAASSDGSIVGGTQDNGTQYISKIGTEKKRAQEIFGGDGFRTEISTVNKSAFIVESYYGRIGRSTNKGTAFGSILDRRVARYKFTNGLLEPDPKGDFILAPFNTGIKLSEVQDSISRLFVGANECVWMVEHVLGASKNPTWFRISNLTNAFVIETSNNGKNVFVGKNGQVERITLPVDTAGNLFHLDTLKNLDPKNIYPGCVSSNITGNLPNGRFITGIAVDRSNENRLLVTMGNYGNTNYIYYTENALDPVPVWKAVQGNLPAMPVYDAEFVYDNPNMVVIGTEFGVYGTKNITSASVNWEEQNTGKIAGKPFPRVAAYELRQVENKVSDIGSVIVAGTHGRGIFETRTLFTGIKNADGTLPIKLNVFPNPSTDVANIQFSINRKDNLTVKVMDMTGKVVFEKQMNNEAPGVKKLSIETSNLARGTYMVQVSGNSYRGAAKMIVQQ
jgi:hypothetical protein